MESDHTAHVEILSGLIRVFEPGGKYGDPYAWAATLRWEDPETVEIMGALRAPTMEEYRAIIAELRRLGARYVVIKRIKNGVERSSKIRIERGAQLEPIFS